MSLDENVGIDSNSLDFGFLCSELTLLDDYIKAYSPLGKFNGDDAYLRLYKTKLNEYEIRTGKKWEGLASHLERALEYRLRMTQVNKNV